MEYAYLDNAATTPLDPRVLQEMLPYLQMEYGNPSSFHMLGKKAKDAMEASRRTVAEILKTKPEEIIFTSGGTESNNLALLGFARANAAHGKHIITSAVEHHATLGPLEHLAKKEGFTLTVLPVDEFGRVTPEQVMSAIRPDTILISLMLANNEIGTIQPIAQIGNALTKLRTETKSQFPRLHTDACQAIGAIEVNVQKLHVDMLTANGAKIYGPKATAILYVKQGLKIEPLMFGGFQERSMRPGTENIAGIVGFAKALSIIESEREAESARLTHLRDNFIANIKATIPRVRLNGHPTDRLPNNVNISFLDIEGEAAVLYLDAKGIEVSTGSACTSTALDPSHVILAIGLPYEVAHGSLRFTLGKQTTQKQIDEVLKVLPDVIQKLRNMSPVHLDDKYAN